MSNINITNNLNYSTNPALFTRGPLAFEYTGCEKNPGTPIFLSKIFSTFYFFSPTENKQQKFSNFIKFSFEFRPCKGLEVAYSIPVHVCLFFLQCLSFSISNVLPFFITSLTFS
uniref:Uncharacterized protein n=1 Tax=Cacopsylla melanoneura TaxID=428564 RepID=A0A8D8UM20_9HEMI